MATFKTEISFNEQEKTWIKLPDGVMWLRPSNGKVRVKTIGSPSVESALGAPDGHQSQGHPYWDTDYDRVARVMNLAYGTE